MSKLKNYLDLILGSLFVIAILGASTFAISKSIGLSSLGINKPNTVVYSQIFTPIKPEIPQSSDETPAPNKEAIEVINLSSENSVTFDQAFSDESVQVAMRELQELSDKLADTDTIYLVMNSPGGSVPAGLQLYSFIKGLPQKVKTITIFAASMGFQTVQQLDERLILENGTLMSHQATFGVQGETEQVKSRLKWILSMLDKLDQKAAERMGISLKDYKALIDNEYWAYDKNAVNEKAADRMVLAKCDQSLKGTKFNTVRTMFGNFKVETARCPLIPGFISVSSDNQNLDALDYVKLMYQDRESFTKKFIVTNKFEEFQK